MSVDSRGDTIFLVGDMPIEEAEPLAALLLASSDAIIDWSQSRQLHTAVAQVLLAFRPRMLGEPADDFSRRWLAPLLPSHEE